MTTNAELAEQAAMVERIKVAYAPAPGERGAILDKCEDCGVEFVRRRKQRKGVCFQCGTRRYLAAMQDMNSKSGPIYEKACRNAYAFWRGEMERLNLL